MTTYRQNLGIADARIHLMRPSCNWTIDLKGSEQLCRTMMMPNRRRPAAAIVGDVQMHHLPLFGVRSIFSAASGQLGCLFCPHEWWL